MKNSMKNSITVLLIFMSMSAYSQVAFTPSVVNMSKSNGYLFNSAKLDMISGNVYLSEFGKREFRFQIIDMYPSFVMDKVNLLKYSVSTKDENGMYKNFEIYIKGRVIEQLSQLDGNYNNLFTISK